MANFRRRRPALYTTPNRYNKWREKAMEARGIYYYWLDSWPAWHDIEFHRRPPRRRTKAIELAVLRDRIDPEEATWPLAKRPHTYYW